MKHQRFIRYSSQYHSHDSTDLMKLFNSNQKYAPGRISDTSEKNPGSIYYNKINIQEINKSIELGSAYSKLIFETLNHFTNAFSLFLSDRHESLHSLAICQQFVHELACFYQMEPFIVPIPLIRTKMLQWLRLMK